MNTGRPERALRAPTAPPGEVAVISTCRATRAERREPLPGDALIADPLLSATHAIDVAAPPERVWPWLAQMGAGRGGWYSWDRIDNGGAPGAVRIVPELQRIGPGDVLPAEPGLQDAFVVARAEPPRAASGSACATSGSYSGARWPWGPF